MRARCLAAVAAALSAGLLAAVGGARQEGSSPPSPQASPPASPPATTAEVLAAAPPEAWRPLDPGRTLHLELPGGRVVIELAPAFAPRHVANVVALVRAGYFDGLAVIRSQDNYVVQWGDPRAGEADARPLGEARPSLAAELDRAIGDDLPFVTLPDGDVYAPEVGFSLGFPVARDPASGRTWLAQVR